MRQSVRRAPSDALTRGAAAGEGARAWTRAARTAWSALNEFCFCFCFVLFVVIVGGRGQVFKR